MKNITQYWPNLSRAYEVALAGGHTISLFYDSQSYPNAVEDLPLILKNFTGVTFKNNGDILVELYKPDSIDKLDFPESIESIVKRVEIIKDFEVVDTKITTASQSLINTAYDRINLSVSRVENVMKVAKTIAKFGKSDSIKIEHIAEAIQYSYIFDEDTMKPLIQPINLGATPEWAEVHYQIVEFITLELEKTYDNPINQLYSTTGRGGVWELAFDWTNEFQAIYGEVPWIEDSWWDTLEGFINKKVNELQ